MSARVTAANTGNATVSCFCCTAPDIIKSLGQTFRKELLLFWLRHSNIRISSALRARAAFSNTWNLQFFRAKAWRGKKHHIFN